MHVIPFLNSDQRDFIQTVRDIGSVVMAQKALRIPKARFEEWQADPDFRLALDDVAGQAEASMYRKAIAGLNQSLDAGHMWAIEKVLTAVNPELWNPAQRIQLEIPKHRFISFDGKDLHTGEDFTAEASNGTTEEEGTASAGND
jgi:hypothetical protein